MRDLEELENLIKKLDESHIDYIKFYEPDIEQITAVVITPSEQANKIVSAIPLAGKKAGDKCKHAK